MRYRRLGESGLKVSTLGLGSWLTVGGGAAEEGARATLRAALDAGVNLIDTADVYADGEAEAFLGRELADVPRRSLVVATKVYFPTSDDPNDRGLSRKHVLEACEGSLRRLRLDYVDLYLCHRHDPETPLEELVRAMDDLIRQGKVLYWGVSCWSAAQVEAACEVARRLLAPPPIANQVPYSLLRREQEAEVVPGCARAGVGTLAFSPLEQGLLSGKYSRGRIPPGSRLADDRRNRFMKGWLTEANFARVDALGEVARRAGLPLPTLALAWCLRRPEVASAVMGASRPEQLRANVAAAELELEPALLAEVEDALAGAEVARG